MSRPKRGRKQLRNPKPEVGARILEAAADLIRTEGFPQLRVEEIAERAGLSVGTFYLYFEGKDDLFVQLVVEYTNRLRERLRAAYAAEGSLGERMRRALDVRRWIPANVDNGVMLHHMVLASQFRSDPTCSGNLLGLVGERFFASGNERTVVQFPSGFGYRVGYLDQWNLIYDLMNMMPKAQTVYIEMTFTYTSGTGGLEPVRPVWLDIDQCGDSEYSIPAGFSDRHWDWNVNVPGRIVAIGGHVHTEGHGLRTEAANLSTGQSICNSVATYGGAPDYIDMMGMPWISSMSTCIANPVATVSRGQTVRLHSVYDSPEARDDVMGIMIAFIDT